MIPRNSVKHAAANGTWVRGVHLTFPATTVIEVLASERLDFVYIDGEHTYEAVRADLEAWWDRIGDHGIMAGHDWTDQPVHAGVKRAVTEFAEARGLTVYLTTVPGYHRETCPSWYTYKAGEMPGPDWRRC